jgi:tRNA nucleotidyltransferase/poly(A) polymerase
MADYIYLLENRLSPAQKHALTLIRQIAREKGLTVFLVGGAVRDLTSGSLVRDLDVAVQGNALKIKKEIEQAGGVLEGEQAQSQALFVRFPGGVRMEVSSTLSTTFPKPGKPVVSPATILEDLRRRDFTANAMALSLNEGSYGLLMDPLNGVADIENRELRLISNYGFIEDPIRMVRAARLMARLGWQMDEKTQARYETGKQENYIEAASAFQRGYEAEEIVHEEDPLRVLKRMENEGWMKVLAPAWTTAKVNAVELEKLREMQVQLQLQGIHPDPSAGNFPLLTAKLSAKEVAELKHSFPRQGFVAEIESLDAAAKDFAAQLSAKTAALPSQAWKLLHEAKPEAVLAVAYTTKSAALQAKFKSFFTEWPSARQKVPYSLMQEMRITPELPGYAELVESLTFALMDGRLGTNEEMRAFLEPYSPPAPAPTISLRRARGAKKEVKLSKARLKKIAEAEAEAAEGEASEDLEAVVAEAREAEPHEAETQEESEEAVPAPVRIPQPVAVKATPAPAPKTAPKAAPLVTKATPAPVVVKAAPPVPKPVSPAPQPAPTKAAAKAAPVKTAPAKAATAAKAPTAAKAAKPAQVAPKQPAPKPAKAAAPPAKKAPAKQPVALAKKAAPAKKPLPTKPTAAKAKPQPVTKAVAQKAPVKAAAKKVAAKKPQPAKKAIAAKAAPAGAKKAAAKKPAVAKKVAAKGKTPPKTQPKPAAKTAAKPASKAAAKKAPAKRR